ncbi:hypothetical protein RN001_010314 [Aquatica leii]|uniref:GRIP domain-containing protein n=1 Tax=Aquatica leii TaxID=1421715 RepID=A0AAN7P7Q8_9COLE|nr:hypothetical protein RN001_010314 [Aquatica leii]
MFKKLKDKIAEEVKSSPQRIQQLTQSVTEKIHTATSDDSFFSIGEDDAPSSNATPEPGFSNVYLSNYSTPQSTRVRKNSNSSVASDMSFLPRYESATNLYHLQSDLDVSASEVEDNVSTSSQLGHLTKEQIYAAFQKAQMRYHKYRGRYTDIANHYRELERENGKMKSVLVETQDTALRRVAELREQCSLEQKAKAHLENALRIEIDEKQYKIDTLKTKIDLLQNKHSEELLVNVEEINLETLTKDLKDARSEIENLNERLQESKANAIIFNSKESDLKNKIRELEELNRQKTIENADVLERERENNLIIAQTKMELHTEIQNRDLEIENLKHDVEILKTDLEQYENKNKSTKLENLQSQNTKLIEKIESLSQKCKSYESELLKLEQVKIENEEKMKEMEEKHFKDIETHRESTKQHLLNLEAKIREKVEDEFKIKEEELEASFEEKLRQLAANTNNFQEIQVMLLQKEDDVKDLSAKVNEVNVSLQNQKDKYQELETNHLELINENRENMNRLKEVEVKAKLEEELRSKLDDLQHKYLRLEIELGDVKTLNAQLEVENVDLKTQISELIVDRDKERVHFTELEERVRKLTESNDKLREDNDELVKTKLTLQKKLKDQKTKFHSEIQGLNTEILAFKEENVLIQSHIDEYNEKLNEYEASSTQKSVQLDELVQQNEHMQQTLQNKIVQLSEKEHELVSANQEVQRLITENDNLRDQLRLVDCGYQEKIITLEQYEAEYKSERIKFVEENAQLITSNEHLQTQISNLKAIENEHAKLGKENRELEEQVVGYKSKLGELQNNYELLRKEMDTLSRINSDLEKKSDENNERYTKQEEVHQQTLENYNRSIEEVTKLEHCNNNLTKDNETLMKDIDELKHKLENFTELQQSDENLEAKNKKLITRLATYEEKIEGYEKDNYQLQNQVRELEHQYTELGHERQLLQDEIQELKISPLNANNNSTDDDTVGTLRTEHEKEINHLNEKIVQYKSLDLTNRTSIQFYENELQKLKNKNEKLNRKLDETLVTLNHCTELTTSTETEYLRNVLYNYMLGKEGLVLARVIAAVCKFDDSQTEAILQREQQKQTLLGQLGFR